jgi:peroxiredoxin Q/BCP
VSRSPLDVGDTAPDVAGTLVHPDGTVEETALSALVSDKPVLLSFYTADFSPDCIEEWCAFRDFDWFASGDQVQVVGVSKSGPRLHKQFLKRLDLNFPLYSDSALDIAEAYGVDYRLFGLVRRSKRSCFLIDTDRVVRYVWVGSHWLDATRDTPPVSEIHEAVKRELGEPETETFGF